MSCEIVIENLSKEEAHDKERELITLHGLEADGSGSLLPA